jgi:hypothetical protein
MSAAFIIARLRDAQVSVTAEGDKLLLEPQRRVTEELRVLCRRHKNEILTELRELWPGGVAKARDYSVAGHPSTRDERAEIAPRFPQAITSRYPWRRGKR